MKKLLLVVLSVIMVLSIVACGKSDEKDADNGTTVQGNDSNENESNGDVKPANEYTICNNVGDEIGQIKEEVVEGGSKYVIEYSYEDKDYKYEFTAASGIKYGYIMEDMTAFSDEKQNLSVAVYTVDMTKDFENYDSEMKDKVLNDLKEYTEDELIEEFGISDAMENKSIVFEDDKIIIKGELQNGSQRGMMIMELIFGEKIVSKMYTYLSLVDDYNTEHANGIMEELRQK